MKYFEPVLAPPEKPEPWWKRLTAYLILCLLISALGAGGMVASIVLGFSNRGGRQLLSDIPVEEQNFLVESAVAAAALLGFVIALAYCVNEERKHWEQLRRREGRGNQRSFGNSANS